MIRKNKEKDWRNGLRIGAACLILVWAGLAPSPARANDQTTIIQGGVIGTSAGTDETAGIYIGQNAGSDSLSSPNQYNIGIGTAAGISVRGSLNTATGPWSGLSINGSDNSAYGRGAGSHINGAGNVASGNNAGRYVTGDNNIALGTNAGSGTGDSPLNVNDTIAVGNAARATVNGAMAFGDDAAATGNASAALGKGAISAGAGSAASTAGSTGWTKRPPGVSRPWRRW